MGLGHLQVRKVRGPILDVFYARLKKRVDLACSGRPFTERRNVPVHAAPNPAPLLAKAAPLLTAAAESGQRWAMEPLAVEMSALAATAAWHIDLHLTAKATVRIVLSGGIWSSLAAKSALTAALQQASGRPLTVTRSVADPLEGAVRLAESFTL